MNTAKDGTYADHVLIHVLPHYLNRPINVVSAEGPDIDVGVQHIKQVLVLGYFLIDLLLRYFKYIIGILQLLNYNLISSHNFKNLNDFLFQVQSRCICCCLSGVWQVEKHIYLA